MQSVKSQIFIGNALVDLMQEKPYNKITVRDIADWAYISRATFYNHFSSTDDVLEYLLSQSFAPLIDRLHQSEQGDMESAAIAVAESVLQAVELLSVLRDQELLHRVPRYILKHLRPSPIIEYRVNALFYGAYGIAVRWPNYSADDIGIILLESRHRGIIGDLRVYDHSHAPKKRDHRTEQTVRALHTALCVLMQKKPLYSISVGELTALAKVGRSSFYRHYGNLEQVVHDALRQSFLDMLLQEDYCDCSKALSVYAPSRILFRSIDLSGKELDGIECLYKTMLPFVDPLQDDVPWAEILRNQAQIWCAAANHVSAVLLCFRPHSCAAKEFIEMIK